jgi:hypothetical protein
LTTKVCVVSDGSLAVESTLGKEVWTMTRRISTLLAVLAVLAIAAVNGGQPWGP